MCSVGLLKDRRSEGNVGVVFLRTTAILQLEEPDLRTCQQGQRERDKEGDVTTHTFVPATKEGARTVPARCSRGAAKGRGVCPGGFEDGHVALRDPEHRDAGFAEELGSR